MTDFKALCAELVDELNYQSCNDEPDALIDRARTALAAEPVPEVPSDEELDDLHHAVFYSRLQGPPPNTSLEVDLIRAALARWGHPAPQPVLEGPSDEELEKLADDYMAMDGATGVMCLGHLDFARAALARWSQS